MEIQYSRPWGDKHLKPTYAKIDRRSCFPNCELYRNGVCFGLFKRISDKAMVVITADGRANEVSRECAIK